MSENLTKYHPVIDENFVTEGEETGLTENTKLVHEAAMDYDAERNRELMLQEQGRTEAIPFTRESDVAGSNRHLRHAVGRRAVDHGISAGYRSLELARSVNQAKADYDSLETKVE